MLHGAELLPRPEMRTSLGEADMPRGDRVSGPGGKVAAFGDAGGVGAGTGATAA